MIALCLSMGLLGIINYQNHLPEVPSAIKNEQSDFMYFGKIVSFPENEWVEYEGDKEEVLRFQFRLKQILHKNTGRIEPAFGVFLTTLYHPAFAEPDQLKYGNHIWIKGKARPLDPLFWDNEFRFYYEYLKENEYSGTIKIYAPSNIILARDFSQNFFEKSLNHIHQYLSEVIEENFSGEIQNIIAALILGQRGRIDQSIENNFRDSGIIHILAISGLHTGIITLGIISLFGMFFIPRRVGLIITVFMLLIYMGIVNFKPSVVRSVLMFEIFILIYLLDRDKNYLNGLFLSGLLMLLINPGNLFLVGAQLSFLAVLGILMFAPFFNQWLQNSRITRIPSLYIRKPLIYFLNISTITIFAISFVIPVQIIHFHSFSFLVIFSNLVVIPLITIVLIGCFYLVLASFFSSWLSMILGYAISFALYLIIRITDFFAGFEGFICNEIHFHPVIWCIYYGCLCSLGIWLYHRDHIKNKGLYHQKISKMRKERPIVS